MRQIRGLDEMTERFDAKIEEQMKRSYYQLMKRRFLQLDAHA
jgi:hypothetical protein